MELLSARRKHALTISAVTLVVLSGLSLPPAVSSAAAQTKSPAKVMKMRTLTTNDIMVKVRRRQTTPISEKLSAGEVGTVNDQEVKCFKKRSGGLVQVKCPDIMIVETK